MISSSARLLLCLIPGICLLMQNGCDFTRPGPGDTTVALDTCLNTGNNASVGLLVISEDPDIIWSNVRLGRGRATQDELVERFLAGAAAATVARGRLVRGRAVLRGLKDGKYWVVTAGLIPVGAERLLWSLPLPPVSDSTGVRELVLQRSNAALVLGSKDCSRR